MQMYLASAGQFHKMRRGVCGGALVSGGDAEERDDVFLDRIYARRRLMTGRDRVRRCPECGRLCAGGVEQSRGLWAG
jgi:hypothetical protein